MNVVYPINGKNERMGSLFSTPKHLLKYHGEPLILQSIRTVKRKFHDSKIIILTNDTYYTDLKNLLDNDVNIILIGQTSSQVETIQTISSNLIGPTMFVDCDILPIQLTDFDENYATVFTFLNDTKLLNYSNYKSDKNKNIVKCNEKRKLHKYAGSGIYYFPDIKLFNQYSSGCKNISECVNEILRTGTVCKVNTDSTIKRFGTLQDIYIDNFSFRNLKQKDLSTGFTENKVYRDRNVVTKIGASVGIENEWYRSFKDIKHIPKIFSCDSNRLVMEYIHRNDDFNLDDIFELIHVYKNYEKLNSLTFDHYINNIETHLQNNDEIPNGEKLLNLLKTLNVLPTFCHGDLSIMNMIPTINGIKLFDPLYSAVKFGSYELDLAKLCFSFKYFKNDTAAFDYIKNKSGIEYLNILIAAESVRVATYKKQYSFISENLINEL